MSSPDATYKAFPHFCSATVAQYFGILFGLVAGFVSYAVISMLAINYEWVEVSNPVSLSPLIPEALGWALLVSVVSTPLCLLAGAIFVALGPSLDNRIVRFSTFTIFAVLPGSFMLGLGAGGSFNRVLSTEALLLNIALWILCCLVSGAVGTLVLNQLFWKHTQVPETAS